MLAIFDSRVTRDSRYLDQRRLQVSEYFLCFHRAFCLASNIVSYVEFLAVNEIISDVGHCPNLKVPPRVFSGLFWSETLPSNYPPHFLVRLIPNEIDAFAVKVIGEHPTQDRD